MSDELTIADYEEVLADMRRLTRELDVALHGEEGAAKQASLCDLIEPARAMRRDMQQFMDRLGPRWFLERNWFPETFAKPLHGEEHDA